MDYLRRAFGVERRNDFVGWVSGVDGLDVRDFHARFSATTLGQMEPVFGVMFLNVPGADLDAIVASASSDVKPESSVQLLETFWHEAYHCFQTYATGYLYNRAARIFSLYIRERASPGTIGLDARLLSRRLASRAIYAASALLMVASMRGRVWRKNLATWLDDGLLAYRHKLLARRSPPFSSTVVEAIVPNLRRKVQAVLHGSNVRGPQGLSATDIIEGAAVLYAKDVVRSIRSADDTLIDGQNMGDSPYEQMIRLSHQRYGPLASRTLRTAAALALRYDSPGAAYMPLLDKLRSAPPGEEIKAGQGLSLDLPSLPGAGRQLGTARELRNRHPLRWHGYSRQLDALNTGRWGLDELDLLVESEALRRIPIGELGFGVVTRDGIHGFTSGEEMSRVIFATELVGDAESLSNLQHEVLANSAAVAR